MGQATSDIDLVAVLGPVEQSGGKFGVNGAIAVGKLVASHGRQPRYSICQTVVETAV